MSAERACFSYRELRLSTGTRVSRRKGVKTGGRKRPRTKVGEKVNEIRQTCNCKVHRAMRRDREG